jgi:acetylornithine deacetylase
MSTARFSRLHDEIAARRDELVQLASSLIAFPTVSPPGRNTGEAQAFVADYLSDLGFDVDRFEVYPGDPDVVGRLAGSDPEHAASLLINGHIDVAEIGSPELWTRPPFEPVVVDGRLYGRGATDMKGPLAAALLAIRVIRDLGIELPGDLLFESVIGEEQGETGTLSCIERGYAADFALVAEPTDLTISGQGGVITGWIEIQSPETLHDGMRSRVIHAGGKVRGANAIEKMMKLIAALQELERDWAVLKRYPGFAPGATTINPAVIEGGRHPAFMADRCALWVTVHFYPDERWESVTAEIEDHLLRAAAADLWLREHPPTFRWGGRSMIEDRGEIFPASAFDRVHPGVQALAAAHEAVRGEAPGYAMWPSVSDAGWLASAGMQTVIYGPGQLAQAHVIDEWVEIDALVRAAQVYAELIVRWCNSRKPVAQT